MSDERLRVRLVQAGYQEEVVGKLDRQTMMSTLAKYMADEEERTLAAVEMQKRVEDEKLDDSTYTQAQAGAMSLEERPLVLEEKRFQMEEQRWRAELEFKERQRQDELKQRQDELKERQIQDELKEKELELRRITAEREEKYKERPAVKLKLWDDALRNTISRMPNEPTEIVSWFISLDRLFDQLSVPNDLRAVLMRPRLNERAKNLLPRCEPDKTHDYKVVKKFLLQEMQLTPSVYLNKINSVSKESNETYHQFGNRLTSLFEYYVESWQVSNSYDRLMQLVVYDRVKSSLPSFLARHMLAMEASCIDKGGWLGRQELIDALYAYVAGMNNSPKPAGNVQKGAVTFANKSFVARNVPKQVGKVATENNGQSINSTPKLITPIRCFGCGATGHLLNNCPDRRTAFSVGKKSMAQSQQISHCAVDKPQGSFAPPCSNASVQSGLCAIARHDASPPGGPLQDTAVSPRCDVFWK